MSHTRFSMLIGRHRKASVSHHDACVRCISYAVAMENTTCQICEKSFYNSSKLQRHNKTIHGSVRYQCPICIKRSTTKDALRAHINRMHCIEHEEKDAKDKELRKGYQFVCDYCEKRFKRKKTLYGHVRGKHSTRYYQCTECIRRFHWRSNLVHHMKKTHVNSNLVHETKCSDGMGMFKLMVDQCVPLSVMEKNDQENIKLYMRYLRNKASLYMDENVDYT